jgi:hypothetical protein
MWLSNHQECHRYDKGTLILPQALLKIEQKHVQFNPSAWGLLKLSSYCGVGRVFYRAFKFGAKLCSSLFKIM